MIQLFVQNRRGNMNSSLLGMLSYKNLLAKCERIFHFNPSYTSLACFRHINECLGFGGEDDDVLINHCLLLARYYIYCCKFKNVSPCIGEYVQRLKFNFEIGKQVSMVTGSEKKIQQRWCKILQAVYRSGFLHYFNLLRSLIQNQFLLKYFFSRVPPFFILLSVYFALNWFSPLFIFFYLFIYLFIIYLFIYFLVM